MKLGNEVKGVRPVGPYKLRVTFKDGYIGEVDLGLLFNNSRGPITEPFKDPAFFKQVIVDSELGVPRWPNGYDLCADVLRYYCELGRVASSEELKMYFDPTAVSMPPQLVLNDKPLHQ